MVSGRLRVQQYGHTRRTYPVPGITQIYLHLYTRAMLQLLCSQWGYAWYSCRNNELEVS